MSVEFNILCPEKNNLRKLLKTLDSISAIHTQKQTSITHRRINVETVKNQNSSTINRIKQYTYRELPTHTVIQSKRAKKRYVISNIKTN